MSDYVTLKLWFGGSFMRGETGLTYNGRIYRTANVEVDEFCWFTLVEEAEKCGTYNRNTDAIFFMNPDVGFQRVVDDIGSQVMCKFAVEHRVVQCYLVSGGNIPHLMHLIEGSEGVNAHTIVNCSKKLTPRRKGQSISKSEKEGPPAKDNIEITTHTEKGKEPIETASLMKEKGKITTQTPSHTSNKDKGKIATQTDSHTSFQDKGKKTTQTLKKCFPKLTETLKKCSPKLPEPLKKCSPKKPQTNSQPSTNIETASSIAHVDVVEQLYDFNDITIADVFNAYEEDADLACLNVNADLESEDINEERDPGYVPGLSEFETESESGGSEVELAGRGIVEVEENFLEAQYESDGYPEDDECKEARKNLKEWNAKALAIAKQLELEAANILLPGQETHINGEGSGSKDGDGNLSEYDNSSDEIETPGESDEESIPGKRKKSTVPVVNERTDFSKLKWCVGIRFPTREIFRDCVTRYAIAQGRNLTFVVSDNSRGKRLGVKCKAGCPFKLYGSWDHASACILVKTVNPSHNCQRTMERNRQLKSSWLAKQFLEVFKARPHWPASEIIDTVRRAYKIIIKKGFAYKIKYYAHKLLHGSMRDHYSKVGSYMAALKQEYPTSVFTLDTSPSNVSSVPVFKRLFVCFDALRKGWLEGCRKLVCVDTCFLKTFLGGQLISAIGRDGNDQMFPIAWAVVEGENNDSYEWFFQELKKATREEDGEGWTIISDEHQSIISMVKKEFPRAEHRRCARHIFANWHKSYKGDEMKMLFWNCAQAYNQADFDDAINALKEVDPRASEAFLAYNPALFCRAFINTATVNDVIVNNMAETFNAYIINARSMHLIYMLEEIRTQLMKRMAIKKKEMEESSNLVCPNIQVILEKEKEKAAYCIPVVSSPTMYQVKDGIDELKVNLEERTCTCRKWDVTGIPCAHAIAAIFDIHALAENYVHPTYKREAYLRAYNSPIGPCPGDRHWPKVDMPMVPPPIKVGPGRPRKKRRRDPHEDPKKKGKLTRHGLEMSCSVCRSKEHNKRKCPQKNRELQAPPKRGRGRPKSSNVEIREDGGSCSHHVATAFPSRTGRGGRVVTPGRGGRGGRTGARGAARGRGRGQRVPQGLGVLIDDAGNAFTNLPGTNSGPRSILAALIGSSEPSTQASSNQV